MHRPCRGRRVTLWRWTRALGALSVLCASSCSVHGAEASDVPHATVTLPVASRCLGVCYPRLVSLDNGTSMVNWIGEDNIPWAQAVDLGGRQLLGKAVALGEIATAARPISQPLFVPIVGGDVAVVGVLMDGRITVMRGSKNAAARFAPKVVAPASSLEVLDVAAVASADGIAILIFRGEHSDDLTAARSSMELEVHFLDPRGDARHPPMHWKSAFGVAPRIAACGGHYYLAWQGNTALVTTSVSPAFERTPERLFRYTRGVAANLGPLICTERGARLFTAWRKSSVSFDLASSMNIAELSAVDGSERSKAGAWKTVPLPAPPRADNHRTDVTVTAAGVHAALKAAAGTKLVTLASIENPRVVSELNLPDLACIPTTDASGAVCVGAKRSPTAGTACPRETTEIRVVSYGPSPTRIVPSERKFEFWSEAAIPNARAPAAWVVTREKSLLRCGTPGFAELRDALYGWCANTETKPTLSQGHVAFCDLAEPTSLLAQATTCSDGTQACGPPPPDNIPSVDRIEFERGKRVEFSHLNCSVWFSKGAQGWAVVDHECSGE